VRAGNLQSHDRHGGARVVEVTEITEIPEALRLLNELVRRGEEMLDDATKGPWEANDRDIVSEQGVVLAETKDVLIATKKGNGRLIAASRSLVPAIVAQAKALIETWNRDFDPERKGQRVESSTWYGRKEGYEMAIIDCANASCTFLLELGWLTK